MPRHRHLFTLAAAVLLTCTAVGCRGGGRGGAAASSADYSMRLTGYDVPRPASVPFTDPADVHEYLFFYHSAYWLTANDPDLDASTRIRPHSDRAAAAQRGWDDGQRDARQAKQAHWRRGG